MINYLYSPHTKRISVFVVGLVVACAGAHALWIAHATRAIAFFSRALENAHVYETVDVNGILYTVQSGTVLRENKPVEGLGTLTALKLAYAAAVVRRNPLFSLAGTDPQLLRTGTENLAKVEDDFIPLQATRKERNTIHALYPLHFLHSLALSEEARLAFLEHPSALTENAYEKAQYDTAQAYLQDMRDFRNAFLKIVPSYSEKYGVWGGTVSRDSLQTSMVGLVRQVEATKDMLLERHACFAGYTFLCNTNDISLPLLSSEKSGQDVSLSLLQELRSLYAHVTGSAAFETEPVVLLQHATCISDASVPPLLLLHSQLLPDGVHILNVQFLGDGYFQDATTYADSIPYFAYYAAHDVRYVKHSIFNNYQCPTFGADFGLAAALQKTIEASQRDPFSMYASGNDARRLKELEKKLAKQGRDFIPETDIRSYINTALSIFDTTADVRELDRAIALANMVRNRSADMGQMLAGIASLEKNIQRLQSEGVPFSLDASYLFLARSGFFSLFMGGNESVTGTYISPYEAGTLASSSMPFVRYSTMDSGAKQKVLEDMRFYITLHSADL